MKSNPLIQAIAAHMGALLIVVGLIALSHSEPAQAVATRIKAHPSKMSAPMSIGIAGRWAR